MVVCCYVVELYVNMSFHDVTSDFESSSNFHKNRISYI